MDSRSIASAGSVDSGNSLLNSSKSEKQLQWWFFGPVLLAVFMFLLMGTIFERRIEGVWRNLLLRRQERLSQPEPQEPQETASVHDTAAVKNPSQRSVASCKAETTTSLSKNDIKQETKSMC